MDSERIETINELRRFQALQLGKVDPGRQRVIGLRIEQLRRRLAELDARARSRSMK
jgi:hypothetical protein